MPYLRSVPSLSTRLQKADRFIPNPSYHPYSRGQMQRRSSSPPRPSHIPSLINPSTPSTSTLSSLSTVGSHPRVLRRSASTISSTTSNSRMSLSSAGGLPPIAADPRVQRVRRSESFCGPIAKESTSRHPVKRAPSYGALAQEARDQMPGGSLDITAPYPSSDEEEKLRTRRAKKPRMRSTSTSISPPPLSPSPEPPSPASATRSPTVSRSTAKAASPKAAGPSKRTTKKKASVKAPELQAVVDLSKLDSERPKGMTIKRNPSMFGAELPRLHSASATPVTTLPFLSAAPLLAPQPTQPAERVKTLRRVRRLPPARRISFGSLIPPVGEDGHEADMEECEEDNGLGSAFQLR